MVTASRIGAALLVALTLAACGSSSRPLRGTIRLGVDLPLSGGDGQEGIPALNGIRLAVEQAGSRVRDYRVVLVTNDDSVAGRHDSGRAVANLNALLGDPTVLGVIGPLHSTVAQALIPVAAPAHLVIVSPSTTDECLTRDLPAPECGYRASSLRAGDPNNFFRLSATDDQQGPAVAGYARDHLALGRLAAASDSSPYGDLLMNSFVSAFAARGGQVAPAPRRLDLRDQGAIRAMAQDAAAAGAQGLFLGGVDTNNACAVRRLAVVALPGPMLGGDAILSSRCLADAGPAAPGMIAVSTAPDATHVAGAQAVLREFAARYPRETDYGPQSIPAYEATQVLLQALGRAIDAGHGALPAREDVRAQVARATYAGPLGKVEFTPDGDPNAALVTVYESGAGSGLTGAAGGVDWIFSAEVRVTR